MALEISTLKELDTAKVDQMFQTFTQLIQERHPDVELTRGVFHDLVIYFNSLLNASVRENIDRVLASNSLLKITENPALADDTVVDQVLSNFNLTRDTGARAEGEVTIVFGSATATTVPAGIIFSADQIEFAPTTAFLVLPPGSVATEDNERVMVAVGDGTYAANILMRASLPGISGNIRRGTTLLPNFPPNNMSAAFAATDFVYGTDAATNVQYLARLKPALASKTIGGRQNYIAAILGQTEFANIPHVSVLGCGDPEQQRDQHSLLPISGGGKIDIYAQTHSSAQEREHLLEAVYVGPSQNGTIWQTAISRDAAPGFYEIIRVAKPLDVAATGYEVISDLRGVDLEDLDFVPDIVDTVEGAYTRYQTAVVRFEDTDTQPGTLVAGESRAIYAVTTSSLPLIGQLQDYLSDRDVRARAADVLVKAAVPCFTKISLTVRKEASAPAIDAAAIRQEIVNAVLSVGFSGQLHASMISAAAHKHLTGKQAVGAVDMFGRIRRPDGSVQYVRDNTLLQVPNDPNRGVTGRTTAFLVSVEDVSVSVASAGFTD